MKRLMMLSSPVLMAIGCRPVTAVPEKTLAQARAGVVTHVS